MIQKIADGRSDLVFSWCDAGSSPSACDENGVSLMQWCAYYGDVSAIRFLLGRGALLTDLGPNYDLNGAAFHGHWQLCQFLIEQGADANCRLQETGETPLHAASSRSSRGHEWVVQVLLNHGAQVQAQTLRGISTGSFMRDCRTTGETPLHRAAAYASEGAIRMLLTAGADRAIRDMNGDSPLSWASWHQRPPAITSMLCFGDFHIHPQAQEMEHNMIGHPHVSP